MNLDQFLYQLHYDVEKLSPPGWETDWLDAPFPYKLYQDVPAFTLSLEVPLTLEQPERPSASDLVQISHFLWYTFGVTKVSQSLDPFEAIKEPHQSLRRFVPSGGALYPNELYVYVKLPDLPSGIYHYDSAHHRLMLVREGNYDSYIARALGNQCTIPACFATVLITTMFWKNYFKYNNFSYRLQGLDAGVLIRQLLEVSKRFGFDAGVYFHFLDQALNHLLGLSDNEESVYAVIPLSIELVNWKMHHNYVVSSSDLSREIPAIQRKHLVRSKKIKPYPKLVHMNQASMIDSSDIIHSLKMNHVTNQKESREKQFLSKSFSYDLADACRKRFSPEMDFILGKVSLLQLSTILRETADAFSYRNDLHYHQSSLQLYCCLNHIEKIPDGAYFYDSDSHSLKLINQGDYRTKLQYAMTMDNINLQHIPICIHIAGSIDFYRDLYGYRGYRIMQMEAGIIVQRLLLTAAALGMNGHPLLGFDTSTCDDFYRLKAIGNTCLIQVPVGYSNSRPWIKGQLIF